MRRKNAPRDWAEQGSREKTLKAQVEEVEAPRSQGLEETILALGAIPLPGMWT